MPSQALTRQLSQRESLWWKLIVYRPLGKPLPLGEVAMRSIDGEGKAVYRFGKEGISHG